MNSEWVAVSSCNFRDGIATNSSEYNQIRRANKCSSRWSASSSINTTLLAEINVHEIFVRSCIKKKNYFSILPFPFHILFREQERSFAKRAVAQSLIKLIELNKNPIYIYIGIIRETKKRIHKISKAWWYRTVTKAKREKLRKPLELSSNGDSLRSFLQALLYFSFNENSINERSRLYFVGVDGEEDGRGGARTREKERSIDRKTKRNSNPRVREERRATTIATYRLSENCACTRANRVKLFAVTRFVDGSPQHRQKRVSRIFPLPAGQGWQRLDALSTSVESGLAGDEI